MGSQLWAREVDVAVIGDAFVDILAPVADMPQWGQDLEARSISQVYTPLAPVTLDAAACSDGNPPATRAG